MVFNLGVANLHWRVEKSRAGMGKHLKPAETRSLRCGSHGTTLEWQTLSFSRGCAWLRLTCKCMVTWCIKLLITRVIRKFQRTARILKKKVYCVSRGLAPCSSTITVHPSRCFDDLMHPVYYSCTQFRCRQVNQSQFIDGETSFTFSNASSVLGRSAF